MTIKLYCFGESGHSYKAALTLNMMGLDWDAIKVDFFAGETRSEAYRSQVNELGEAPVMVDGDVKLTQSGVIQQYLAEKTGQLMPHDPHGRADVMQWLMWQMGGLGPMLGQVHHFTHFNPGKAPYAESRYHDEAARLYGVLESRLSDRNFICDDYSIADMAAWPWVSRYEWQEIDLADFVNVRDWYRRILDRDAVQRGYHIPKHMGDIPPG